MRGADALREIIRRDRFRAHSVLFAHRHEYAFAPFHRDLIADFWCGEAFYIDLGFRECGKTTLVEEAITVAACEGGFRNCVIVCAKESLAAELLTNVKVELENNDAILGLYGDLRGDTWTQTKITLRSGHCIQAVGRDQSLRGTKHRDWRPDLVVINDFEDDEEVLSPEGRRRTLRWVLKVLLPACDRSRRKVRIYDTVRDPESVPMMLHRHGWPARFIPVSYLDAEGVEQPSWPGHPTMTREWLAQERGLYARLGELDIWEREYMCNAETQSDRTFRAEHFKVEAVPRTWQAVYGMYDPARTVRRTSATTGWAFWSWVKNRLIVWECGAKHMLPDEIIDHIFEMSRRFGPVEIGVEEDGLNEWLLQPIRVRMLKEGVIPYRGVRAPRGKIDFIRGLQPFFAAGEVSFAAPMPDLQEQLLGFPTGRIDAPNALAYALQLKPGRLIYEAWNPNAHIEAITPMWARPLYVAVNATRSVVSAALCQMADGRMAVISDWVAEGDASEVLEGIVREASLAASGSKLTLIAGRQHWEQYGNVGLVQAARSLGLEVRPGGDPARGRELIRKELGRSGPSGQLFCVAPAARWTLNGFAGGYSRPLRDANLAPEADDNHYRLLFEGLEAFCGLMAFGLEDDDDEAANFAYAPDGRRYRTAMPARMQMRQ
jgi:hypothetical protein